MQTVVYRLETKQTVKCARKISNAHIFDTRKLTLVATLARVPHGDVSTRIYPRADESLRYSGLINLMDLLRAGGYLKIALVSRQVPQ